MPTYYLSNTNSDLTGGADFSKKLLDATESANSIVVSVAPNSTETSYAWTEPDIPSNGDWETGGITVEVKKTSGGDFMNLKVSVSRVNSSGTVQETTTETAEQGLSLGGPVYTFSIASYNWAAGSASDRIRINYIFRNSSTKGANSVTIETGTTDTEVVTSITEGTPGETEAVARLSNLLSSDKTLVHRFVHTAVGDKTLLSRVAHSLSADKENINRIANEMPLSSGVYDPPWVTDGGAAFFRRRQILMGTDHDELPVGYTVGCNLFTGYEERIATTGVINESVIHAGRGIAYYNGYTYVVWQAYHTDGTYHAYIKKYQHSTSTWSAVVDIGQIGGELHHYPWLMISNNGASAGKLHIFYGAHDSDIKYKRSVNAEDITSWTAEQAISTQTLIPSVRSYQKNNGGATASATLSCNKPSGVQAGDLLLLICMNDDDTSTAQFSNNKSGWTFRANAGSSTSDCHIGVFWRIATGSEGASESVTAQSSDQWAMFYICIKDVDTTSPINTSLFIAESSSASTHNITQVTTSKDNCLAVYGLAFDGGDGAPFSTASAGWSEVDEVTCGNNIDYVSGCWGSKSIPTAGGTGSVDVLCSLSDGAADFQLAINGRIATNKDTYPRAVEDTSGNIYLLCRGKGTVNGEYRGYHGYYKSTDGGVTWSEKFTFAYFSAADNTAVLGGGEPAIYSGGVQIDENDRLHVVLTYWAGYASANKGRYVTYMYTDDFVSWKKADGTTIGTTDTDPAQLNDVEQIFNSGEGAWPSGPIYMTNTEGLALDSANRPYFLVAAWYTTIREPAEFWLARWNGSSWVKARLDTVTNAKKIYYHRQMGAIYIHDDQAYVYAFVLPDTTGEEYFAPELMKWRSLDGGLTWTVFTMTKNTGYGIPQINCLAKKPIDKPRELLFCRGKDVFWLQDIFYPYVRLDGNDVRIYRQEQTSPGNYTTTELDRLPDRFQAEDTEIIFKLDVAVPANENHPSSDNRYWVYYSWPTAPDPPHNPQNVLVFLDSFESYLNDTAIDSQNGWSGVTTFRSVLYYDTTYSGQDTNKIYAGAKSLRCAPTANDSAVSRNITLNAHKITIWLWNETPIANSRAYIELFNSTGSKWIRLGLRSDGTASNCKASYLRDTDGGTWTDSTQLFPITEYHKLEITITSLGVSFSIDGVSILTNDTNITSCTTLRIGMTHASMISYFDYLEIRKFVANEEEVTLGDEEGEDNFDVVKIANIVPLGYTRVTRLANNLLVDKNLVSKLAQTLNVNKEDLGRFVNLLNPALTDADRMASLMIGDETLLSRISSVIVSDKEIKDKIANLLDLDKVFISKLANSIGIEETKLVRLANIIVADKTLLQKVANFISLEDEMSAKIVNIIQGDKELTNRIASIILSDKEVVYKLSNILQVDSTAIDKIANILQPESFDIYKIANLMLIDKELESRISNILQGDKEISSRISNLIQGDSILISRFVNILQADKELEYRIHNLLVGDKEVVNRISNILQFSPGALDKFANIIQLEGINFDRISHIIQGDSGLLNRIHNILQADKEITDKIANYIQPDKIEIDRLSNILQTDKGLADRINSILLGDKEIIYRISHQMQLTSAIIGADTKIANIVQFYKEITQMMASITNLETVIFEKIANIVTLDKEVLYRLANIMVLEEISTDRISNIIFGEKIGISRIPAEMPLEGSNIIRLSNNLSLEIQASKRMANLLIPAFTFTSRFSNFLQTDKNFYTRISNIMTFPGAGTIPDWVFLVNIDII